MLFRKAVCAAALAAAAFSCAAPVSAATTADAVSVRYQAWAAARESSLSDDRAALAAQYERITAGLGRILDSNVRISPAARAALADILRLASARASELRAAVAAQAAAVIPVVVPETPAVTVTQENASPVFVAKAANGGKEIGSSALRFTVAVDGNSKVPFTLGAVTVSAQLTGYAGAATVNVYRTDISSRNRIGSGAVTGASQVLALSSDAGLNRVDQGSSATFVVTVEGVSVDPAAHALDWTVRVADVDFGSFVPSAAAYSNLGSFPMVETK